MNTLKATIGRLCELSSSSTQGVVEPSAPQPQDQELEVLVSEIERMAGDALYRGRPLGQTALWMDASTGVPVPGSEAVPPSDLSGVEILEGRFESTNDRLVGMFEETRRGQMRAVAWNPHVIHGLRAELAATPLSPPIIPLVLRRMKPGSFDLGTQIRDRGYAGQTADLTREQILSTANISVETQANTSDRVVESLLL